MRRSSYATDFGPSLEQAIAELPPYEANIVRTARGLAHKTLVRRYTSTRLRVRSNVYCDVVEFQFEGLSNDLFQDARRLLNGLKFRGLPRVLKDRYEPRVLMRFVLGDWANADIFKENLYVKYSENTANARQERRERQQKNKGCPSEDPACRTYLDSNDLLNTGCNGSCKRQLGAWDRKRYSEFVKACIKAKLSFKQRCETYLQAVAVRRAKDRQRCESMAVGL